MTGGAAAKRKGTRAELIVRDMLRDRGWYVIRAWSSIGSWDLLALRPDRDPAMVQVKSGAAGAYIRPRERALLLNDAAKAGADAVLVYYPFDGKGERNVIVRQLLGASSWDDWSMT